MIVRFCSSKVDSERGREEEERRDKISNPADRRQFLNQIELSDEYYIQSKIKSYLLLFFYSPSIGDCKINLKVRRGSSVLVRVVHKSCK